ncbi:single-stranded nucleic acid binding R3H domain protein [Paenibacillus vortex V453]|uniref:RNA-binding protein KhpB n=2 Tax=Paenibacillus TaxID=44249 RepID=A0A163IW81_9BACL|nr:MULTISPECIES: RNA-binding cell elongation regulator Jag/EloR [Paenibacillus]AWP30332.1 protein jag [Paenibacillus sp. Cedars]EFU43955.1 single-stranded nucleic acid binding R3H domain protein [Paenibacillus vortex V453]KZS46198.1 protein jag [Paenibacillus glucanolyticus]MDH6673623.1 spoIIIJ-associated protein [Paenibacillus sp. LBL]OMF79397.1 protein jag [Paenibacillus glucanolyticus]
MSKIVATGKTIEDAVAQGLARWGVSQDRVSVQVLSQPSRGFLGLFGVKEAKVELTLLPDHAGGDSPVKEAPSNTQAASAKEVQISHTSVMTPETAVTTKAEGPGAAYIEGKDPYQEAIAFLLDTGQAMGLDITVELEKGKDYATLQISGAGLGLMIGRRGQTLDALQYLANIVANRYSDSYLRIVLDAENFRDRRRKTLEDLADRLAGRVLKTRKEIVLEPMPAAERKVIHAKLQSHGAVKTYSKGEEPNRRVVITPKSS